METKHAPLPWAINGPDLAIVSHRPDNKSLPLCVGQVYHIINYGDMRDRETTTANAAFIVLACNSHYELVEALKRARVALANEGHHTGTSGVLIALDDALAKAKGG